MTTSYCWRLTSRSHGRRCTPRLDHFHDRFSITTPSPHPPTPPLSPCFPSSPSNHPQSVLSSKHPRSPLAPLQHRGLRPQHLGPELPKRALDPLPTLRVARDDPRPRRAAAQQAQLAAEEQPAGCEERVGCYVAQGRGAEEGGYVGKGFYRDISVDR